MKLVERAHFNPTDVSVSAQIERVKAANPQAFIAWSTGAPIATIFKGIVQAGLDVPIGTTDGNMTYAQMKQYAAFLPKQLYFPCGAWAAHEAQRRSSSGGGEGAAGVLCGLQGRQASAPDRGGEPSAGARRDGGDRRAAQARRQRDRRAGA